MTITSKVHAYILVYNEERILRFVLDYYSKFCEKIIIYDNESTDASIQIALSYPKVKIISWSSNEEINEAYYMQLKSSVYKESRGVVDWVIVCDCDELLYNYYELDRLKRDGIQIPKITGYQMTSAYFPHYDGACITGKIKNGYRDNHFDKQIVFDPEVDISFAPGAHSYTCPPGYKQGDSNMLLLHYKNLSPEYVHDKSSSNYKRLSEVNISNKLGAHYSDNYERNKELWEYYAQRSLQVIP